MAIHQRGFQWQAITRLPGSSACCLCCCCSLGPQLPNSPWKQYLYIYYIFTQYLPCCKTISYLTINSPMFLPPPFFFFAMSLSSPLLHHRHICLSISLFFFEWCFFLLHASISFFSQEIFLPPPPHLSFRLVYRWNWIFLLSHGGQSLRQLPSHSKVPQHCERKKYRGKSIKKTVIASISISVTVSDLLSSSLPWPLISLSLSSSVFALCLCLESGA